MTHAQYGGANIQCVRSSSLSLSPTYTLIVMVSIKTLVRLSKNLFKYRWPYNCGLNWSACGRGYFHSLNLSPDHVRSDYPEKKKMKRQIAVTFILVVFRSESNLPQLDNYLGNRKLMWDIISPAFPRPLFLLSLSCSTILAALEMTVAICRVITTFYLSLHNDFTKYWQANSLKI